MGRGAGSTRPAAGLDRRGAAEDESADLSITARVTADSLCFERVPNPRVEFPGRPERSTVWEAERENLPQEVRPGVTYRDIGITLRITSVFADIDRIVAEALGEVPADADAPADATRPVPAPPAQPSNSDNARPPSTPGAASRTPAPSTPAAQFLADPGAPAPRRRLARRGRTR